MVESTRKGAGGNRTQYASAAVDAALAEARTAPTKRKAQDALLRAERLALADAPLVPLFHSVNVVLRRPWVTGFVPDPLGAPRYDHVEVRRGH
jgi:ABC-type oligopeptide transport system substrate-binding subunit